MGVIRALGKLVRNPGIVPSVVSFAHARSGRDSALELKRLRRLRAHARKMGAGPAYQLRYRAYEAEVLIRCGRVKQARRNFLAVFKKVQKSDGDTGQHIRFYARYWIAILDGDQFQAVAWARQAHRSGLGGRGVTSIPTHAQADDEYDKELARIEDGLAKDIKRRSRK